MKKRNLAKAVAACALVGALAVGASGTLAYLTDSETATNVFTVGEVKIDLEEPNYPGNDSDDVKELVPNEEVKKDPQIENTSINDAIVYLKMSVPVRFVTKVADDGTIVAGDLTGGNASELGQANAARQWQEIFYFKDEADTQGAHANHFGANWIELDPMAVSGNATSSSTTATGVHSGESYAPLYIDKDGNPVAISAMVEGQDYYRVYYFGYNQKLAGTDPQGVNPSALTSGANITEPLFDKVQLKNVLEAELVHDAAQTIKIDAYAIQANEILENNADLTDTLSKTNLEKIYDIYMNQNTNQDTNAPGAQRDADLGNNRDLWGAPISGNSGTNNNKHDTVTGQGNTGDGTTDGQVDNGRTNVRQSQDYVPGYNYNASPVPDPMTEGTGDGKNNNDDNPNSTEPGGLPDYNGGNGIATP